MLSHNYFIYYINIIIFCSKYLFAFTFLRFFRKIYLNSFFGFRYIDVSNDCSALKHIKIFFCLLIWKLILVCQQKKSHGQYCFDVRMCNIDRGLICFYGKYACFNGFTWFYEFKECLNSNLLLKLICYTMVKKSNEYNRNKNDFINKKKR